MRNSTGNLIGIALNLYTVFGSIVNFTIFILPIQEHGISLHVFMFYFFHKCLIIFYVQFFVSLGKFIPRYLILFVAMVNGIDSLSALSDFSLLV